MTRKQAQEQYDKMSEYEREQVNLWIAAHDVSFEQAVRFFTPEKSDDKNTSAEKQVARKGQRLTRK